MFVSRKYYSAINSLKNIFIFVLSLIIKISNNLWQAIVFKPFNIKDDDDNNVGYKSMLVTQTHTLNMLL